jgi:hypothetical protein
MFPVPIRRYDSGRESQSVLYADYSTAFSTCRLRDLAELQSLTALPRGTKLQILKTLQPRSNTMRFFRNARTPNSCGWKWRLLLSIATLLWVPGAAAQTCQTADEIDPATRRALETSARQDFDFAAKGDVASLRQSAIPSVASDFGGIEAAVKESQADFSNAQIAVRPPFLLQAEGKDPLPRAEFLCGVFGKSGQTANSAVFVIPNLPPGDYGIVTVDVASKVPMTLSLVLQKVGADWKLGGYYARAAQAAGHDGKWFLERARAFKAKGQNLNAWLYYVKARDLMVPVPFMSTLATDQAYDESQSLQPAQVPSAQRPLEISAEGNVFRITSMFPIGVENDVDLVVKYRCSSVANATQTYQQNMAAIRALVAKYPEFRDGFAAIIARAVEPSGKDYGTMVAAKEIK